MPSKLHEAIVEMLRENVLMLLRAGSSIWVSESARVRNVSTAFSGLVPDYRPDSVVEVTDVAGVCDRVFVVSATIFT